jgi:hypothetical protein
VSQTNPEIDARIDPQPELKSLSVRPAVLKTDLIPKMIHGLCLIILNSKLEISKIDHDAYPQTNPQPVSHGSGPLAGNVQHRPGSAYVVHNMCLASLGCRLGNPKPIPKRIQNLIRSLIHILCIKHMSIRLKVSQADPNTYPHMDPPPVLTG